MHGAFGKLEAQVSALNTQMAQMVALQNGVDPSGFERMTRAAATNSQMFRSAAASTGMFEVQQLKVNRATDEYIKKLQKQKLSFRDLMKQRKIAAAAYKEQLAMENMVVRQNAGSATHGKQMLDVIYPREVSSQLNTASRQLAFFNEQLKSGATQMVNWGKNTQWAGRQLMVGFTMPIMAFGAAAGVMAYQIDKELTRIAKVYDTTAQNINGTAQEQIAVEKELASVRDASMKTAMNSARAYGSAATDTLNVQAELAATGLKGAQLQEYTSEVMRISTLGELEYSDAINSTIALQSTFNLSTRELTDAFNYMNAVENATSLQTKDFAAAIPIAAGPMKAWGGDIKELGVLLTAMRENGIGAAEGANAIKATLQRLARPSAQIREEWQALTGTDITKIVDDSESLTEVFTRINEATRDLAPKDQRKAFAGLFGSYQVSRMMAMTKGMEDLANGTGQVSEASRLAGEEFKTLSDIAEQELAQQAASVSGQWNRAFEEMKLQVSTLGEPFLKVATVVVKGVSWMIEQFNSLPGPVKTVIAALIGMAAVAGPLVMLTGLFANLSGQALKGITTLIGLSTRMNILDRDSRAAALGAQLAEAGFIDERTAVQQLTTELNKLALAQEAANRAAQRSVGASGAAAAARGADAGQLSLFDDLDDAGQMALFDADDVQNSTVVANNTEKTAEQSQKVKKGMLAAGAATTAMAAGMALTMTNSNETANAIGNFLVLGSVVVPAATLLVPLLKSAAVWAWNGAKGLTAQAVAAARARGGVMGLAAGTRAAAVGVAGMMGPIGWIAAAATAVGVGIFAWQKHTDNVRKEQERLNASVNDMADTWAESAGKARKEWAGIVIEMGKAADLTKQQELYEQYKSGDMKGKVSDFQSDEFNDTDRKNFIREHFMELQAEYGLSQQEAAMNIRALLAAAGEGLAEQNAVAEELLSTYGQIKQANIGEYIANQIDIANTKEFGTKQWSDAAKDAANAFVMGFNQNMKPGQAKDLVNQFADAAMTEWTHMYDSMANSPTMTAAMKELGINSANELRKAVREAGGVDEFVEENARALQGLGAYGLMGLKTSLNEADKAEREFFGNVSKSSSALGMALNDNIDTFDEFADNWAVRAQGLNLKGAQTEVQRLREAMEAEGPWAVGLANMLGGPVLTDAQKLRAVWESMPTEKAEEFATAVATMAKMQGIQQGKDAVETYFNILGGVKIRTDAVTNATRQWANAARVAKDQVAGINMSAMQGVQQDMADAISNSFDTRMNNALEARQSYWDKRQQSLSNEMDRRQNALDAKWESKKDAAEKYWDRRVEAVEKAIDAEQKAEDLRQKMFDAEIARINKLNEMANTNIDFNVALNSGNFDEAAKIRNDTVAGDAQTALERAAAAGTGKSEARIDRLEGRRDAIEDARERHMRALEKQEEAERRHLERVGQMREAALQKQTDADMEAQRKMWESRKKNLDRQLQLFLSYVARNEKDLKRHMENVGLSYKDFGEKTLKPMGENWASFFGNRMRFHIRKAGLEIQSDKMWEQVGQESAKGILKGIGFTSWNQFNHFIKTGEMIEDNKKGTTRRNKGNTGFGPQSTMHGGGFVGGAGHNRSGVARTLGGLHASEELVRAQKGEYIVNRKAAAKHSSLLNTINGGRGTDKPYRGRGKGDMGGEPLGLVGMTSGIIARMMLEGVKKGMENGTNQKKTAFAAATAATMGGGTWGNYSLPGVKPWVLEAANYLGGKYHIGTIGGVGQRSNYSEHPLGRALDFMVSDERGTALANEVVRNHGILDAMYVIWRQRINSFDGRGWRGMEDRGSATANHMDHVHVSFNASGKVGDLPRPTGSGAAGGTASYAAGAGGWHRPTNGHYSSSHDIPVPQGTPVFAVANGNIVESRYITSGGSPGNGTIAPNGLPYRSYGETMVLDIGGTRFRYAHLQPGSRVGLGPVRGGQQIARSGNTGNSSGPHLHTDVNGAEIAQQWLRARGVSLRKGAENINFDHTIANLHKGEAVLTRDISAKFREGVNNFANGGNAEYNVKVYVTGTNASADEIAERTIIKIKRLERRKPQSRRK